MNIKIFPHNYRIEFRYGACVYIDATTVDDIYSIDINSIDKYVALNGIDDFVIASALYEHTEEIGCFLYDKNDNIDGHDEKIICENGKLNLKLLKGDKMKIKEILKPFVNELDSFLNSFGDKEQEPENDDIDGEIYIMIDDSYFVVDMNNSYWYHEDDGTVVFRVNDIN